MQQPAAAASSRDEAENRLFRLAGDHGIVLLNGNGFADPGWLMRILFANLDDHVYDHICRAVRANARGYRQAYEAATGKSAVELSRGYQASQKEPRARKPK